MDIRDIWDFKTSKLNFDVKSLRKILEESDLPMRTPTREDMPDVDYPYDQHFDEGLHVEIGEFFSHLSCRNCGGTSDPSDIKDNIQHKPDCTDGTFANSHYKKDNTIRIKFDEKQYHRNTSEPKGPSEIHHKTILDAKKLLHSVGYAVKIIPRAMSGELVVARNEADLSQAHSDWWEKAESWRHRDGIHSECYGDWCELAEAHDNDNHGKCKWNECRRLREQQGIIEFWKNLDRASE